VRVYRERLGVPATWWLAIMAGAALLGSMLLSTMLLAGLSLTLAITVYLIMGAACAAALLAWGAVTIEVSPTELRAGSARLPLARTGEVTALTREQTTALRGPRADPAAFLLSRPYLPESVYVEVTGRPVNQPYWLIASRRPADLAASIARAKSALADGPPNAQKESHVT